MHKASYKNKTYLELKHKNNKKNPMKKIKKVVDKNCLLYEKQMFFLANIQQIILLNLKLY